MKNVVTQAMRNDDGILACLRYFREDAGCIVSLCSDDRMLRVRARDCGVIACSPGDLLGHVRQGRWVPLK
jgi:predicted ribonuclease YlaK